MSDTTPRPQPCCESSMEAGEPQFATAPRTDVWILLEYTGPWGAQALPDSDLPAEVKAHLDAQLKAIPNARFQFIKGSRDRTGYTLYVAKAAGPDSALYHRTLNDYQDLLAVDLAAVAAGQQPELTSHDTLYLVCTNGRRDICCARDGVPLYQALSTAAGDRVWQTTHIGGHRFSATLVILPYGLYYGRLTPADAPEVLDSFGRGELLLEKWRGLSFVPNPVQAAEYLIRQQTGRRGLSDYRFAGSEPLGENRWRVTFSTADGPIAVEVTSAPSSFEIYESTGDPARKRVPQYALTTGAG